MEHGTSTRPSFGTISCTECREAFPFAYQSYRVTVIVHRYGWVDRRMSDVRTHMQDGVIVCDILSCICTYKVGYRDAYDMMQTG